MTEMDKLNAGLPYRYDDPELVAMKDAASLGAQGSPPSTRSTQWGVRQRRASC